MTHEEAVQQMCEDMAPHLNALVAEHGWDEAISILKVIIEDAMQYDDRDEFERIPLH